ncbi:DNA adenine methylase [Aminipila butyrica]|uniref:site-specific DNA-methyltransferase (adenine-specific) n=1 Tax=Aminipila butyrica TaxID=433296 RepID=A0A858BYI3_9FIRM|nr:DNA adenine methylase [Aminipila butyrica]QIB70279.1 DNA adenine methylase [Aminipila butyrica]
MRYLGNKESILQDIENLLQKKGLLDREMIFFDAFCGTGTVADYFKKYFGIIINDNLKWSTVYAQGRICSIECTFEKLGFDPFKYLNNNEEMVKGFNYKNYCPALCDRMYFTLENAGRIDYFRFQIEEWWNDELLTQNEYYYLLACLIESVSSVSNTAGVYGAFLKKWDSRALNDIIFSKVDTKGYAIKSFMSYNSKIEEIINDVKCDILYLDPPYTQNQYGTQYHLLETLILNDQPEISLITGSRSTAPMRSDWSKEYKANILFDRIMAKTTAKYVILSYNNDGFMSKDFIEASMKRYGKPETYECIDISYKKYQNWKSQNKKEHFEYLFYVEMKGKKEVFFESPLNYVGSKGRIVTDIRNRIPAGIDVFADIFGGGFNVGINSIADTILYNDINYFVEEIIRSFKEYDTYQYLIYMKKIIKKFGLQKANADAYISARKYYNLLPIKKRDPRLLFTIILYGYQQQIRFNSRHEFNNPVGMRWFNDKVLEKMISFSREIKEKNIIFLSDDYQEIIHDLDDRAFVYLDPPYQMTTGTYNDGKRGFNGWSKELERSLLTNLDILNEKNIKFMLSYVVEHKGQRNEDVLTWIKNNNYRLTALGDILGISGSRRKEVLITNYDL